jgi:hypothetical protein
MCNVYLRRFLYSEYLTKYKEKYYQNVCIVVCMRSVMSL